MSARTLRLLPLPAACLLAAAPAAADTLQEALSQAYLTNPSLETARADLRATDENVPIERSAALPTVSATPSYSEFVYDSGGSAVGPARQAGVGLSLGVPLYRGGATRYGILAAETRVLAERATLRGTESSLFSQVVNAYMNVIANEALVGLSRNNVEVLTVNLEATSDRFQIGDLTRTDVAQSEARLALARGDLRSAEANLIAAREDYVALVGDAPTDLQPPPPLPGLPEEVEAAVDIALENNPDLAGARERAAASRYDIRVAGSTRLPQIDATTSADYSTFLGTLPGSFAGVTPNSSSGVTIGARAIIPLFQGGLPAALERQAQARSSAALEQVVSIERDVIAQVRAAYSSWRAANAIIASSQTAVEAAELSLEGVRAENTVGNRTILDILNAQQELLTAEVQLVNARRSAYIAGFSLLASMGLAEARDLGLEGKVPLYDPVENYGRVRTIIWDWASDPDPVTRSTRTVDIPPQGADIPEERSEQTSAP